MFRGCFSKASKPKVLGSPGTTTIRYGLAGGCFVGLVLGGKVPLDDRVKSGFLSNINRLQQVQVGEVQRAVLGSWIQNSYFQPDSLCRQRHTNC